MKVCTSIVATALAVSSTVATETIHVRSIDTQQRVLKEQATTTWVDALVPITAAAADKYHMKPVRAIHARVQGDSPAWDADKSMFTSAYGANFAEKFRASLDTVNTASVEGALMYVQAEGINYASRADADKCVRKNKMKNVVFYDIVFTQPNETLALYEKEWGPFLPMDGGQCTPVSGADATAVFSQPCNYINGDNSEPRIGAFVGGELKDTDPRAPYPDSYWFSFPNTAVKQKWPAKNDTIRAATARGLCDYDKLPDGVTCTFNYRILGYVPIDDVVGITAMQNKAKTATYKNFTEFCVDGGVEFMGSTTDGTWQQSIPFWLKPQDRTENAKRAAAVLTTYAAMLTAKASAQVSTDDINRMTAVPTPEVLAAANPACYQNIKACSGTYGCKRSLYSQLCTECSATDTGCTTAVSGFTFPTLTKAVSATGSAGNKTATANSTSAPTTLTPTTAATPTPTATTAAPKSGAAAVGATLMGLATVAALAFSPLLLG